jgi:hypothetical protein
MNLLHSKLAMPSSAISTERPKHAKRSYLLPYLIPKSQHTHSKLVFTSTCNMNIYSKLSLKQPNNGAKMEKNKLALDENRVSIRLSNMCHIQTGIWRWRCYTGMFTRFTIFDNPFQLCR